MTKVAEGRGVTSGIAKGGRLEASSADVWAAEAMVAVP